jgi:hypothetical protein
MRLLAILMLMAAVSSNGCSKGPTGPSGPPTTLTVALASHAWETISDPQPIPLRNEGSSLVFDFPATGSVNYLFTPSSVTAIRGTLVVTVQVSATGPVVFESLDPQTDSCRIPTSVRPFIWSNDSGNGAYDRWWSNQRAYTLAPGSASIAVPLQAEHWSSVNGHLGSLDGETRFNFEKALLNVTRFGVTFGGGCSFGHGVRASSGAAKFMLTEYAIR